eukprot:550837-Amphidinium_carterae.1
MEDIKDLRERARSKKDPEAELQYKQYFEHNQKLDLKLREEYEKYKGPIEDRRLSTSTWRERCQRNTGDCL